VHELQPVAERAHDLDRVPPRAQRPEHVELEADQVGIGVADERVKSGLLPEHLELVVMVVVAETLAALEARRADAVQQLGDLERAVAVLERRDRAADGGAPGLAGVVDQLEPLVEARAVQRERHVQRAEPAVREQLRKLPGRARGRDPAPVKRRREQLDRAAAERRERAERARRVGQQAPADGVQLDGEFVAHKILPLRKCRIGLRQPSSAAARPQASRTLPLSRRRNPMSQSSISYPPGFRKRPGTPAARAPWTTRCMRMPRAFSRFPRGEGYGILKRG
jgi:hypothetical protein